MRASKDVMAEWQSFWFLPIAAALGYSTSVLHVYSIGPFIQPLQHLEVSGAVFREASTARLRA
jgi:hypothetical protein